MGDDDDDDDNDDPFAASDLADLFPGFASHWIETSAGKIFLRTSLPVGARPDRAGPPLLMLHGYPQTHVMWHRVAPMLAQHFTLILPDLPGYGWSAVPRENEDHAPYTKRAMANAMVDVMEALGHVRFRLAGHDRGGRVAYRLALDHPGRVERLATLDIVPTLEVWRGMNAKVALRTWHWPFLAQPAPLPELLIGKAANEYFDLMTAAWARNKHAFDPRALAHYRASFTDPSRIHASCEDYRAGATTDVAHDEKDRADDKKITCPMLALWGARGGFAQMLSPLETWQTWATQVQGHAIDSGHFLAEEAPEATGQALVNFFRQK